MTWYNSGSPQVPEFHLPLPKIILPLMGPGDLTVQEGDRCIDVVKNYSSQDRGNKACNAFLDHICTLDGIYGLILRSNYILYCEVKYNAPTSFFLICIN